MTFFCLATVYAVKWNALYLVKKRIFSLFSIYILIVETSQFVFKTNIGHIFEKYYLLQ